MSAAESQETTSTLRSHRDIAGEAESSQEVKTRGRIPHKWALIYCSWAVLGALLYGYDGTYCTMVPFAPLVSENDR